MQLTVDHDLTNHDELIRLAQAGLDVKRLQSNLFNQLPFIISLSLELFFVTAFSGKASHLITRCLGNYTHKGGYKDFGLFSAAAVEPVIAEAEITGPIDLDESCRYNFSK